MYTMLTSTKKGNRLKKGVCSNRWNHFALQYIAAYNELGQFVISQPFHTQSPQIKCRCLHCLEEITFQKEELEQFQQIYIDRVIVPENTAFNRIDRFYENMKIIGQLELQHGLTYETIRELKVRNQQMDIQEKADIEFMKDRKKDVSVPTYKTEQEIAEESKRLLITKENYSKRTGSYYSS